MLSPAVIPGRIDDANPGIHFSGRSDGTMDSEPAPSAQNGFAILSQRRIPE